MISKCKQYKVMQITLYDIADKNGKLTNRYCGTKMDNHLQFRITFQVF